MPRAPVTLQIEPALVAALERWAADELTSVETQLESVLRDALRRAGRLSAGSKCHPYR